ncbi:hypothetical protein [Nocardia blacklockiae]|uniref:hypothetical protein n=1 Tax=Nocardia blacklockiae TaxID=480036 RepID=UPI0018932C60|nr:hypothetical protein [Nocardia blacklockiae]MBF6173025.1 hypothetical protein [Nocardia blacklockiae]
MPSALHEVLADLFRQRPRLAAELLQLVLDTPLPEFTDARLECGDFPDIDPTEYRADAVVALTSNGAPALGVIVEAQLRPDSGKPWSWPVYLVTLRARLRCPVVLLILCPNDRTATWCRTPITLAPGCVLTPVVIGPTDVPIITDPVAAEANPEMTVLSAIAHRNHRDRDAILAVVAHSMVDLPNGEMYIDLVMAVLPAAARDVLETLMSAGTYEYKSEFARRYYSRGEAHSLLKILRHRFTVSEAVADRVVNCTDIDQLEAWTDRALEVETLAEVFEE